jgi:regulator of sigma E protease
MLNFLIDVAAMAVVLGIMIVIHELGHHLVAKFFGVRVEVFSVGFGKRLLGFIHGGTDYRISALPFGGYVKMAGENPMEARTGDPGEFMSHPRWQRILIAIAGPAMNILLAIALLTIVYMAHYEHDAYLDKPAVVGYVEPDSIAAKAGIQPGDRIIRFDNVQNPVWEDIIIRSALNAGSPVTLVALRGTQTINTQVTPLGQNQGKDQATIPGLYPEQANEVTEVEPTMPAYKAGIRVGDQIKSINGQPMHSMGEIIDFLQKNGAKPIDVIVARNGQQLKFTLTSVLSEADGSKRYRMGFISRASVHVDKLPFTQALSRSLEQNKKFSFLIVELVQKMVERKVSMKQVDGPIGIGKAAGDAVRQGWVAKSPAVLLGLMAAISLNLGIFNLLPVPILDGGLILLTLIESTIRRDIDQRLKERIYQTAFVFLVIFAAMVLYNDVSKLSVFSRYLP